MGSIYIANISALIILNAIHDKEMMSTVKVIINKLSIKYGPQLNPIKEVSKIPASHIATHPKKKY